MTDAVAPAAPEGASTAEARILHLASGDLWAGAEVQIATLLGALASREELRIEAVLLNPGRLEQELRALGVPVHVLDERTHGFLHLLSGLRRILAGFRPTVVHTHRQKETVLAGLASAGLGAALVQTVHGAPEHGSLRQRLQARLEGVVTRTRFASVIAVSETLDRELTARYGARRVELIRNGFDVARAQARSAVSGTRPSEPVAEAPPRPRIGFFGRLVPVKRVDLLIEAFEALAPALDAELHVAGDGPLASWLRERVDASPARDRVILHGHLADPAPLMATMSCLVLCSDHEGTPMTMLEAMALRVPIVAHAVGGLAEVLGGADDRPPCASLVQEQSARAYADTLERLLRDPSRGAALAERAHGTLVARHGIEETARRTIALYRRVASP